MTPIIYIAAIVAANVSASFFGPAVTPINAFLFIGLDLSLRDHIQDKYGLWYSLSLLLFAGLVSYGLNPASGTIAFASMVSFVISNAADTLAYHFIRGKKLLRMNGSNIVGAGVDSVLFPTIAFGALMPQIVVMQFLAKTLGGAVWSVFLTREVKA